MAWLEKHERFILVIIFGWVLVVALWCLPTNPPSWFDEGIYHQVVRNLARDGVMGVELAPGVWSEAALISVGYPVFYPAAFVFQLFGDSHLVLRLVAVLFLIGLVGVFYLLARQLYGASLALFSTMLLVLFSPLYGNGKNFLGEVPGLFYFFSALLVLEQARRRESKVRWPWVPWLVSGLLFGLAAASKPNFLVMVPALIIGFLWQWRWSFRQRQGRRALAATLLGCALALGVWLFTQFGGATDGSRILAHYTNPYYVADLWPTVVSNLKRFVTETTPAHFLMLAVVAGYLFFAKLIKRQTVALAEVIGLAVVAALWLFYARTVGWYRYFFPAHIILFLFFPAGLSWFVNQRGGWWRQRHARLVAGAVALVGLLQLGPMFALRFRCQPDAPTIIVPVLNTLPGGAPILFYSVPQVFARYQGGNAYQYLQMSDVLALGKDNLARLERGGFAAVVSEDRVDVRLPVCYNPVASLGGIMVSERRPDVSCK